MTVGYTASRISTDLLPGAAATNPVQINSTSGALLVDVSGTISFPANTTVNPLGIDQVTAHANEVVVKAGTALIGKVSIDQVTAGANNVNVANSPTVILGVSAAEIGKLAAGSAAIGSVVISAGSAAIGSVKTNPGTSIKALQVLTPTNVSQVIGTSGNTGLGLTITAQVSRLLLWASASGINMAYNTAATNTTIPVPTTPMAIDCNATDLALIQMIGDGAKTVNVIQQA
jgi:hypothetical protein